MLAEISAPTRYTSRLLDMTTIADVVDSPSLSCAPSALENMPCRHPTNSSTLKLVGWLLFASLLALNLWCYWRDGYPISDDRTISDWIHNEQYKKAEAVLRERLRRSKWDSQARIMLARVLAARNNSLGCAQELHQVPFWSPEKAEALLREGQAYAKIDQVRNAELAWLEAIKDDPLHLIALGIHHDACQELLRIYAIEDRWEDAFPVIWKSYDRAPAIDHPVLLSMRLRPELERVSRAESVPILRRYVLADPEDREALRSLARAEVALGQHADAAHHFQLCLKNWPDDVRAWRDYLAMLLDEGELDSFLTLLERCPMGADREPETWMYRGVAKEKSGDWDAAAQMFRKAIELNPSVPKYYYRLSVAELRLGLDEAAAAHRQRTKLMNDARAQLPAAYAAFFGAKTAEMSDSGSMDAVRKQLASLCETLGLLRAAQAWNRLVLSP
jgi:tetratricopeptide (TPR) repeat protein